MKLLNKSLIAQSIYVKHAILVGVGPAKRSCLVISVFQGAMQKDKENKNYPRHNLVKSILSHPSMWTIT